MTESRTQVANRFAEAITSGTAAGAFHTGTFGPDGLWPRLQAAARDAADPQISQIFELLGRVASMYVRPDDWNSPYGPLAVIQEMRTTTYTDFTTEEIDILAAVAGLVPDALLRARTFDVLALLAEPRDRVPLQLSHLDALLDLPISEEGWGLEHAAWDRGLLVAIRSGKVARARLRRMETALRQAFASTSSGFFPLRIADLMRKHGLGRDRAGIVARRLARIARNDKSNYERARAFHAGAAAWFAWAGDSVSRYKETLLEVETLLAEADQLPGPGGLPGMQAADRLERALRALRTIPKTEREDLGVGGLAASIARRIREAGAAALGEMRAFSSGPIDLTTAATESRDRVKDLSVEEALLAFVGLSGFASFNSEREEAEKTIKEHPLQSIFGNVHFSTDGRVIYRSAGRGGTPIYGVDPALWRQMIQRYSLRINFLSTGALWPAFQQITNQHHLGLSDFLVICAESGVVPVDRITQFARGLFYGYCGDFSSAMQLLVPQIENTVRNHLANAGDATSTVTPEGLELEVGLSALMDRQNVEEVFGEDLAFEIRALLCGPLGPNLRNEVAHGLINDATAGGAYGLYCWWFALRLVYLPFWNRVHDADAADGREPRKPEDFRDEMAEESPVE